MPTPSHPGSLLAPVTRSPLLSPLHTWRAHRCIGCCCPCVPQCRPRDGASDGGGAADSSRAAAHFEEAAATTAGKSTTASKSLDEEAAPPKAGGDDGSGSVGSEPTHTQLEFGCIERFFSARFAPLLVWSVDRRELCKPFSILLVLVMGTTGVLLSLQALEMQPPTEQEAWFPGDHMLEGLQERMRSTFVTSATHDYVSGELYLGLAGLSRPRYNKWAPEFNRGDVIFDDALDLSEVRAALGRPLCALLLALDASPNSAHRWLLGVCHRSQPAAQASFLALCADLRAAPCGELGCTRPPRTLVVPSSVSRLLASSTCWTRLCPSLLALLPYCHAALPSALPSQPPAASRATPPALPALSP